MNKYKLQSGSAHIIFIIVISVVLFGALGYIYWQNFKESESASTMPFSKNIIVKLSSKASITFSFPENWKAEKGTSSQDHEPASTTINVLEPDGSPINIVSPSENIVIGISSFDYYIRDQTCPSSYLNKSYLSFESQALTNYNGVSYVQYISKDHSSSEYMARLQNSPKYSDQEMLSKSVCTMNANSLIEYKLPDGNAGQFGDSTGTLQVNIAFYGDIKGPGSSADTYSLSYIKNTFNSSEFKTAKNILLSAKFTEY